MNKRRRVWIGFIVGFTAYDLYCAYSGEQDDSWSESNRSMLKHPVGRALFHVGWPTFAFWYWRHILHRTPIPGIDRLIRRSPRFSG